MAVVTRVVWGSSLGERARAFLWAMMMSACCVFATAAPAGVADAGTPSALGKPVKPAQLDDADWASLRQAIATSLGQQPKLAGDGSGPEADGAQDDQFGVSVALSGDTALVGTHLDDIGGNANQGSVYVYTRNGTTWTQQAKLIAGDGAAGDEFGSSVALFADTALVGALKDTGANGEQGSAYVFVRSDLTWTLQAKLVAGDGAANDAFGVSVALSEDTALVGTHLDDIGVNANQGSAYVYTRNGTTWTQQAKLVANDGVTNDQLGYSVALSGDTALVGAISDDIGANSNQGSIYVYTRNGVTWTQQAKLVADDGAANDQLGYSVALSGDTALAGAIADDIGANSNQGSVYVYTRSGTTWTQEAQLVADDGATESHFGWSVALVGNTALVGAWLDDIGANADQGAAYVYTRSGIAWTQQAKLVAVDGAADDLFGNAVALSEGTALIGAFSDDVGANSRQGSAYLYTYSGNIWTQYAKLDSGRGAASDLFGYSVAVSGDTALVGAYGDDINGTLGQGSAYVFTHSGKTWTRQAKLMAIDGALSDQFGYSVALFGDTALVGARLADIDARLDQGSTYVFTRTGTTWAQQAKLVADDGAASDQFGYSVALSGDTALIGAMTDRIGANINQGSAYIFTRIGTTWSQQTKLVADDGATFDQFGNSVALSADIALVGAHLDDIGANPNQGSAYTFVRSGTTWTQQAQLVAGDGAAFDRFGVSVALSGDVALVGACFDDIGANTDQGSAYMYSRFGTTWKQQAQVVADDGTAGDLFGFSVALSGDTALVGAPTDDIGAISDQGSAYVYRRLGTTWSQLAKLMAGDGAAGDQFGGFVALSGNTGLVGASGVDGPGPYGNMNEGAAYVYTGIGQQDTITVLTSASPDPSMLAEAVTVQVAVSGAITAAPDGLVTVTATTGESCTDSVPAPSGGTTTLFACSISFNAVGPRTLVASFTGSATHADSTSSGEPHAVITQLSVSPASLPGGTFGASYDQNVMASGTGSTAPYSFSISNGALPPGLTLDPTSGQIIGTATSAGSFAFEISATDSSATGLGGPFSGSRDYIIDIARANQQDLSAIATPASINLGSTSSLSSSGGSGSGALSYAVSGGGDRCEISGAILTGTGIGACTVTATKAADINFNPTSATVEVTVLAATDLEASKSDGKPWAIPNTFVVYEILVANAGRLGVTGARVEDPLPAGLADALWTCAPVQNATCPVPSGNGAIDQLVDLPAAGVLRFEIAARVTAALGSSITNTVSVSPPDGVLETNAFDNIASDTNLVVADVIFMNDFESASPGISVPLRPLRP